MKVTGVKGPLKLDDVLYQQKKSTRISPLQVVRCDRIVGEDHILQAERLAKRAFDEGRNKADKFEVEFLRYLAARRTIREAIEHLGLPDTADGALVIGLGDNADAAVEHFIESLGLKKDDSLLQADEERLRAFGITDTQLAATTPERRMDLVLEACASVDVMRA